MEELEKRDVEFLKHIYKLKGKELLGDDRYKMGDNYWETLNATFKYLHIEKENVHLAEKVLKKFSSKKDNIHLLERVQKIFSSKEDDNSMVLRLQALNFKKYIYCHIPEFKKMKEVEVIALTPKGEKYVQEYKDREKEKINSFIKGVINSIVFQVIAALAIAFFTQKFIPDKDLESRKKIDEIEHKYELKNEVLAKEIELLKSKEKNREQEYKDKNTELVKEIEILKSRIKKIEENSLIKKK